MPSLFQPLSKKYPKISKEWHPRGNGRLKPSDVSCGSGKKVWWLCPKGHEWQTTILSRTGKNKTGCPYCSGRYATPENNLSIFFPELLVEWHYQKNTPLLPENIKPGSSKKVWWKCKKGHEWEAQIKSRTTGRGCPYCKGRFASKENNLKSAYPDLAKEWHPTKNLPLTPETVTRNSGRKVWWTCKKKHIWESTIDNRVKGKRCPYCSGRAINNENSFYATNPKIASQWHPTKNKNLSPKNIAPNSNKKVWWLCSHGHEWKAIVSARNRGTGCPYCRGKLPSETHCLQKVNPKVSREWHPTKNKLTPREVTPNTHKKVWWKCKKGHEWEAAVYHRNKGRGCPFCSYATSELELLIYAEMKWLFKEVELRKKFDGIECDIYIPEISLGIEVDGEYWHRNKMDSDKRKNIALAAQGISLIRVREKGLIRLDKSDVFYKKESKDFALLEKVIFKIFSLKEHNLDKKSKNRLEQYLKKKALRNQKELLTLLELLPSPLPGFSLKENYPHLNKEWHPTKNGSLLPENISVKSERKIWWKCERQHEWQARVYSRTAGNGCPYCAKKLASANYNLKRVNSNLAKEWHTTNNSPLLPEQVTPNARRKVWWRCEKGHEWEAWIYSRNKGAGCPYCAGQGKLDINQMKDIAKSKGGKCLSKNYINTGTKILWECSEGHQWEATPANIKRGRWCPKCSYKKGWTKRRLNKNKA